MKEENKKIIKEELDKILDKFQNEEFDTQKFINYIRVLKQSFLNNLRLLRKSRECVFPNCSNKSIKKSHSIPKTSTLLNIASKGHLLKPEFDITNNIPSYKMKRIGINNASIFPGYCQKHENIFKIYEEDGVINNETKALLQTYRSIYRERVFREIEIEINEIATIGIFEKNRRRSFE